MSLSWLLVTTEYLVGHQQCLLNPDELFLDHVLKFACPVAHNVSE